MFRILVVLTLAYCGSAFSSVNHTILSMNVNANVGRIAQQLPITKERIEKDLDFFMYFSDSHLEAYNPPSNEEFQKLTVDVNGTLASYNGIASKFLQDCESLFSEGTPQQKVGIFILLQRVADELGKLGK